MHSDRDQNKFSISGIFIVDFYRESYLIFSSTCDNNRNDHLRFDRFDDSRFTGRNLQCIWQHMSWTIGQNMREK